MSGSGINLVKQRAPYTLGMKPQASRLSPGGVKLTTLTRQINCDGAWQMQREDAAYACAAQVPGTVHGALRQAALIPDPFFRRVEAELQWIGESNWIFTRQIEIDAECLAQQHIELVADGLDTFAEISINGRLLARTDNMHRRWRFALKEFLQLGANQIVIQFNSVLPYVVEQEAQRVLGTTHCIAHEPRGRGWIRKEHSNSGWDWGPVLVTHGIYRSIKIEAWSQPRLQNPLIRQQHNKKSVSLDVSLAVDKSLKQVGKQLQAQVLLYRDNLLVVETPLNIQGKFLSASLLVKKPALWWPNGLGDQPLYDLVIELRDGKTVIDSRHKRIGLREISLVRNDDQWGQSFYFQVNGRSVFAKGANWIPADAIKDHATPAVYTRLLEDAAAAHMNMLRVWGGGYFERDCFYEECDRLGLMIWHDFMFACSSYPADDAAFRANVRQELRDQVGHLRHHPSIALWNGNNELEMWVAKKHTTWPNMPLKWYKKIFDHDIPAVLSALDPDRAYWPSSPHTPDIPGRSERENHDDPNYGNAHLWAVWHGKKPFEWYRSSFHRFCSEFGFQSFPEPKTVNAFTQPQDRYLNSPVMEWHQRSGIGNTTIMQYLLSWLPMPCDFAASLWMSQLTQAMAITYAVEHWRRQMPRCMGALYWQLNDNWPVASWSSIDYSGNWKALHYAAKRFFAPVLLSAVEDVDSQRIELFVSSDAVERSEAALSWQLCSCAGDVLADGQQMIKTPSNGSKMVLRIDCADVISKRGIEDLILFASLKQEQEQETQVVSRAWASFVKPKSMPLHDPQLVMRAHVEGERVIVALRCQAPAFSVFVQHAQYQFVADDNFLMMPPQSEHILTLTPRGCTPKQLCKQLQVSSLIDLFEHHEID